jgi:hypothetical protein
MRHWQLVCLSFVMAHVVEVARAVLVAAKVSMAKGQI